MAILAQTAPQKQASDMAEPEFIFGLLAETVREDVVGNNPVPVIIATNCPMPVPPGAGEGHGLLTLLAGWAASSKGQVVGLPTQPNIGDDAQGLHVVYAAPVGTKTPISKGDTTVPVHLLTRFRLEWPLNGDGVPVATDAPKLAPFDEALHQWDGRELPKMPFVSFDAETWTFAMDVRYKRIGGVAPPKMPPPTVRASTIPINAGQESTALFGAAANGKSGKHYKTNSDLSKYFYQPPGATHRVELGLTEQEITDGLTLDFLQALVAEQDVDAVLTFCYVAGLLAPVCPVPMGTTREAWVDLDDVAERIGLFSGKRGTEEREEIRRRVFRYIQFGAKARVIGKRSIPYMDKQNGKPIDTETASVMWAIMDEERPVQPGLFPSREVPRRVLLALNSRFAPFLSSPDLLQFMHGGERIGAIAGGKPSGAWARSIGLVLMQAWRKKAQQAVAGTLLLTRRELLETYPPKLSPAADILNSKDPGHAKTFWQVAAAELAVQGVVERKGEAEPGNENKGPNGAELPRKGWQAEWLDTPVLFCPGPSYRENLMSLLVNRFHAPPRNLAAAPKKTGRPRKQAAE